MSSSLAVMIATVGRPETVADLIASLFAQSRPPDRVICVGASPPDIAGIAPNPRVTTAVGRRGSAHQRNDALDRGGAEFDTIVFLDDDFVPSRYWLERAEALFLGERRLASLTGEVLADGNTGPGIGGEEARAIVAARDAGPPGAPDVDPTFGPYGCNMAFRGAAIRGLRFDERLPLYAWLEDRDFGERARERGRVGKTGALWGVHMGAKNGKSPGLRLGYSQVANAAYLVAKGTLPLAAAGRLVAGQFAANCAKSIRPESWVDRRGRLRGNLAALADFARGRMAPERVLEL